MHTPKLEISNLICFGKIQCTCIEILREHGVEKQYYFTIASTYVDIKKKFLHKYKNSYTNKFVHSCFSHTCTTILYHKLFDYAITKGVKMNSGFATFFCLQRECKF